MKQNCIEAMNHHAQPLKKKAASYYYYYYYFYTPRNKNMYHTLTQ